MDADEYQKLAGRTAIDPREAGIVDVDLTLLYGCIGLAGEAGELLDYLKKVIFHGREMDRDHVVRELGDVLWQVALICTRSGLSLSDVMRTNVSKLLARYPEGYSAERAAVRDGEAR